VATVLERHGFVRTLGGMDVYLALRARVPGLTRAGADTATGQSLAQISPTVRGCIYLVARQHAGLSLRIAELLSRKRQETDQARAGIKPGEVERLSKLIPKVLAKHGPLTTDQVRKALPDGSVRSLGDIGKKVGISSTLPPALRFAEFAGTIERTLDGGRMDTERYLWRVPAKSVYESTPVPDSSAEIHAALAGIFLRTTGVSTPRAFAAWSGIGQREAATAFAAIKASQVQVEHATEQHFILPDQHDMLLDGRAMAAASEAVAFLPFEDNLLALHGGALWMVDSRYHGIEVPTWGMPGKAPIGQAKHMMLRSIVAGGEVNGFWEYDPDTGRVETALLGDVGPQVSARVAAEAESLASFIRYEVGHGRSFSLDTDDELRRRAALVRSMAGGDLGASVSVRECVESASKSSTKPLKKKSTGKKVVKKAAKKPAKASAKKPAKKAAVKKSASKRVAKKPAPKRSR